MELAARATRPQILLNLRHEHHLLPSCIRQSLNGSTWGCIHALVEGMSVLQDVEVSQLNILGAQNPFITYLHTLERAFRITRVVQVLPRARKLGGPDCQPVWSSPEVALDSSLPGLYVVHRSEKPLPRADSAGQVSGPLAEKLLCVHSQMFGLFGGRQPFGGTFAAAYRCYPVSFIDKLDAEKGDKIFLPPSALDRLGKKAKTSPAGPMHVPTCLGICMRCPCSMQHPCRLSTR